MHLADEKSNNAHCTFPTQPSKPGLVASTRRWLSAVWLMLFAWTFAHASDNDFSLPSINDPSELVRLADYQGKAVYLDFWSSWCAPCRESLPLLQTLQHDLRDQPFAVVTIHLDANPRDARKLMEEFSLSYPVAAGRFLKMPLPSFSQR